MGTIPEQSLRKSRRRFHLPTSSECGSHPRPWHPTLWIRSTPSLPQVKATSNALKLNVLNIKGGEHLLTLAGFKPQVGLPTYPLTRKRIGLRRLDDMPLHDAAG